MPKMTDRERLAKVETDQRKLAQEAETIRKSIRADYARIAADLAVETLTKQEFRDVIGLAIRCGGNTAIAALKNLPTGPS